MIKQDDPCYFVAPLAHRRAAIVACADDVLFVFVIMVLKANLSGNGWFGTTTTHHSKKKKRRTLVQLLVVVGLHRLPELAIVLLRSISRGGAAPVVKHS
jgi:hypothetical protein